MFYSNLIFFVSFQPSKKRSKSHSDFGGRCRQFWSLHSRDNRRISGRRNPEPQTIERVPAISSHLKGRFITLKARSFLKIRKIILIF